MAFTFPEYDSYDGLGLADLVRCGVISPLELLEAAIERIELYNPRINAVIHTMYDQARAVIQGSLPNGLFRGVPILLKDLMAEYAGVPLQMGSRFTKDWVPTYDSEIVIRLKQAGVSILGKTNVPELGLGLTTEPIAFGPTRNPWGLTRSSGGSSGGAAAAVAMRMVPIAHAGDGGGSIRLPAAYCGIFGLKPSRGRTPIGPKILRIWLGMVVAHVLTRSVRDSAAMLDILAGPEYGSPISLPKTSLSFLEELEKPPGKLRIALIEEPFFPTTVDTEYLAAVKEAGQFCENLGHRVQYAKLKLDSDEVGAAFFIIMAGETQLIIRELTQLLGRKPRADQLEDLTAMIAHAGTQFSAADFAWAIGVLDQVGKKLAEFFENTDIILTPTTTHPPVFINTKKKDLREEILLKMLSRLPYLPVMRKTLLQRIMQGFSEIAFTALFNISGQPAMSVPLCWDKNGMPIGIQFAARLGEEAILLRLAKQLEEAYPWKEKKPHVE